MPKLKNFDGYRVPPGKKLRLSGFPPGSTRHVPARQEADAATLEAVGRLADLQDLLYAQGRQSLLVVLQGMDAAGKDGTVRKVFDAVNPTGVQVTSFKVPTAEELRHNFLWRCHARTPPRGHIGVFNRSYYEDVLVVRVHADRLLPPELPDTRRTWENRYRLINDFEHALSDASTRVIKFFLHISREEQRQRFIARQKDPAKHWKLAAGDFVERAFWKDYQRAYEAALQATSTADAPWYIIPSDRKWVRNYLVAHILVATLQDMNPRAPQIADKSLITRRFK